MIDGLLINIAVFAIGLALLIKGADFFTESSANIARRLGVSDIVIGMTLVAFSTSLPELMVSTTASFEKVQGIALGNVLGSNIANIGLILAVLILMRKVTIGKESRKSGAVMLLTLGLASTLILSGITRLDGALLLSMIVFYTIHTVIFSKPKAEAVVEFHGNTIKSIVLLATGLAGVLIGSRFVVDSAVFIAKQIGISEIVVGVTIIAVGTSLPELTTSLFAAKKGYSELAIGTLIGSNLFNITAILGLAAIINPINITKRVAYVDIPFMLLFAVMLVAAMHHKRFLGRTYGAILLVLYAVFIGLQVVRIG